MQGLELAVVLLTVAAAFRVLAGRLNIPHPILLVFGGLALAAIPGLPRIELEPETLFLLFVPPLLYLTAFTTSLRDFRAQFWPITRYGTVVVLLTIAAVASVAHTLVPEITWPAAFVLGAIVSPPDPVAAVAVMRRLGAPRRIVTLLEGEGLVNDATALVAYRMGVAAVVTGAFSPSRAALQLLITGAGGAALVIALALPFRTGAGAPFPARELIIFLTFAVIFDTLVLQGLTLKPLLRWLGLKDGGELDDEEAHARRIAAEVGLRRLDEEGRRDGVDPEVVGSLRKKYAARVDRWSARDRDAHGAEDADHRALADRDGSGA